MAATIFMTTKDQEIPYETGGFASDLAGMLNFLIDPEGAAKRVHSKWFWVVPLLVLGAIGIGVGLYMMPMILHVAALAPPPDGATPEQQARAAGMVGTFTKIAIYLSPILAAIVWAIEAVILLAIAAVTSVKARFGELFNLVAGCAVIQTLASIATAVILHFKGEVSTSAELKPAMGFDIFMPEGTNKYLMALGGSFSVFQIWWVVMMALVFAAAFRTSKVKGFMAVLPLWIFGVLLAMVGAAFQR